MLPHLGRRHVARVDSRESAGEQHQEGRLRPFQAKCHFIVTVGGDLVEVLVERFAGIESQLLLGSLHQQVPGADHVGCGERLAVVPSDATAQRKGHLGAVLVPAPAGRQIGDDRFEAVLLHVLVEHDQVVEDAHQWRLRRQCRFLEDRHARWAVGAVHFEDAAVLLGERSAAAADRHQQRTGCRSHAHHFAHLPASLFHLSLRAGNARPIELVWSLRSSQ
jgi:hypothetical protein